MYRLAKRLLASDAMAKDAVQEVMLKLWLKRNSLEKIRNTDAYAMTMVKNYAYDLLRSKQNKHLALVQDRVSDTARNAHEQLEKK